jgi:RNA polymerase sigma-70 factor (ECF subfamily)
MALRSVAARADTDSPLTRAKAGDPAAFEELLREHQSMVFSLAYRFAGDAAAAEDLAQEVFFDLSRALSRIESPAHLMFWLRRVTTHRCIDRLRRPVSREATVEHFPEHAASDAMRDVLLDARIQRLVAELPTNARAVMLLRYQEDLDPSEIATVLEISVNTVKSHLRRSVETLREKLGVKEQA